MSTIYFITKTPFDFNSIFIIGLSAKPNTDTPNGYFGSGLKYAIASIIRNGGSFQITTNNILHTINPKKETFRGSEHTFLELISHTTPPSTHPLPFTTDLGKNWKPWQIFRELYTNTLDEGGYISLTPPPPSDNSLTTIAISNWSDFYNIYHTSDQYFLQDTPLYVNPENNPYALAHLHSIHSHLKYPTPAHIFNHTIKIADTTDLTLYRYNFHFNNTLLTEDRTLSPAGYIYTKTYLWNFFNSPNCPKDFREAYVCATNAHWEASTYKNTDLSDTLIQTITSLIDHGKEHLINPTILTLYKTQTKATTTFTPKKLSSYEENIYQEALAILKDYIPTTTLNQIYFTAGLPHNILGCVQNNKIYLNTKLFTYGLPTLVATLFEELSHLIYNYKDETRTFQDYLISTIGKLLCEHHHLKQTSTEQPTT